MDSDRWIVVGLGNPGPAYAGNRHNVGFLVVEDLAGPGQVFRASRRARALTWEGRLGGVPQVLAKPTTYMNESGQAVAALCAFYKVQPDRVVAVHDELDLPFGSLRLKLGGGDNGHNGLKSIRRSLGTGEFHRVRVGIGRPPGQMDPASFVLRDFTSSERTTLPDLVARASDATLTLMGHGLERAQDQFNS